MAFKQLVSLECDVTIRLGGVDKQTGKKNPPMVEGYFLGSKKIESKKAKSGFAYLHVFQTAKGNLGVWGKTNMDNQLSRVAPGVMVRVTHTGMVPTPNGDMFKYKVEVDEENVIEAPSVDTAPADTAGEEAEDDAYTAAGTDADPADDDLPIDADPVQPDEVQPARPAAGRPAARQTQAPRAAAPSAESVNKVKALLAGRRQTA